jgi:hypothetical protein
MTEICKTWDRLQQVFQANYYTVNSATDLMVHWMTLKQLPAENALMFTNQVASMLHRYQDLLVSRPHPVAKCQQLRDTIKVLHVAVTDSGTQGQEAKVTAAMVALMEVCQALGQGSIITDIMICLTCHGIQDRVIQMVVKKH